MPVLYRSVKHPDFSVMGRQDPDSEILNSRGSSQIQIWIPLPCFVFVSKIELSFGATN